MIRRALHLVVWFAFAALGSMLASASGSGPGQPALPGLGAVAPKRVAAGQEVSVSVVPAKRRVTPGEQLAVAVIFDFAQGWHAWPAKPVAPPELEGLEPIPTTVALTAPGAPTGQKTLPAWIARVGETQWPKTTSAEVRYGAKPVFIDTYAERAVVFLPVVISPTASPGEQRAEIRVEYQACNDVMCLPPTSVTPTLTVEVVSAAEGAAAPAESAADPTLFKDFDLGAFARIGQVRDVVDFNVFGWRFSIDAGGTLGTAALVLLAALGGLLLNLTPCVLPVIPIKIMGLSQSAANPARCLMLGLIMSAGVVAFWLAIGGAIAFIAGFEQINTLFQRPWFALVVGAVIAAMGVGMLGLFTVSLPKAVYMVNPSHDSVHGSFLFGVMTAVLSTPCTAPFMGTAAAWATRQPPWLTMTTFAAIGAGMAVPYLVLSANPALVSRVPRTGPASELVKQVMGLLMLAVATFFLGIGLVALVTRPPDPPSRLYWWIVAGFVVIAGGWLALRTFRITPRLGRRVVFGGAGLLLAAASVVVAADVTKKGPINWVYYTPARFEEARSRGDVVVIDFTAEWCLNCKTLEATVLNRPEVAALLNAKGVTAMKIDLTGANPDGSAKLKSLDWVGIPLLAVFGPATNEAMKFDAYTPQLVKDAVAKARGG